MTSEFIVFQALFLHGQVRFSFFFFLFLLLQGLEHVMEVEEC